MILWVALFLLVVAISFVLAAQSMRDFSEVPSKDEEYSLFLIRKMGGLNLSLLNSIHQDLSTAGSITAFERLFKGKKSALVIFGPRKLILQHKDALDLLELEDYTNVDVSHTLAWGVGIKNNGQWTMDNGQKIFAKMPQFLETEQFWWQIILSSSFKPQLTAVVVSADSNRKHTLTETLYNLAGVVFKLPKAFSNAQLFDFYQKRSIRGESKNPNLTAEQILQLLLI